VLQSNFRKAVLVMAVLIGLALGHYDRSRTTSIDSSQTSTPNRGPRSWLTANCTDLPKISDVSLEKENDILMFKVGIVEAFVATMPAPIPWRDLEGPCATAWWWPDATAEMKKHKAHFVIYLRQSNDNAVSKCILLTKIVAAVTATSNSVGVYWGNGALVYPPELMLKSVASMTPKNLPVNLWIDFRAAPQPGETILGHTTGLYDFGLLEIEIQDSKESPKEVMKMLTAAAEYLLVHGPIMKSGDTIGFSETQRIPVRFGVSRLDSHKPVMVLGL
jgi:hypothetical protein